MFFWTLLTKMAIAFQHNMLGRDMTHGIIVYPMGMNIHPILLKNLASQKMSINVKFGEARDPCFIHFLRKI